MVLKHYTQRTLASNLKNIWLLARAQYHKLTSSSSNNPQPPAEYRLVFSDDFKTVDSSRWRWGQPWGNFHSDQPWWYWPKRGETPSDVIYPTTEGLAMELRHYPKSFKRSELPEWRQNSVRAMWQAPWAAGLLTSRKSFKYGWIEAEIKIPTERAQWSAFWLAGRDNWPPEIDIFEAYTDEDENKISVKPNIHWGPVGISDWRQGKKDWGAPTVPLFEPNNRFIKYACHWTEDFIRIYYDGILVSDCTIPAALKQNSQHQYIILNHGCKNPIEKGVRPIESAMLVRNVRVYQHQNWID